MWKGYGYILYIRVYIDINWNDLIKKSKELKEIFVFFLVYYFRWFKVKDMNK